MLNLIKKCSLVVLLSFFLVSPVQATDYYNVGVGYQVQNDGVWTDFAYGGALAGSEGGDPLDSLEIHLVDSPYASGIEYRVYTASGWSEWFSTWETASHNYEDILGLQIQLKDFPNANVYYQSYRQGLGWGIWVSNGSTSGQLNSAYPITGFRVKVDEIGVNYSSNINGVTQVLRANGETQGTGSLETVSMNLISADSGSIEYRAYLRNTGWTNWASNGSVLGSSESVIEALEARLVDLPQYSVQIQAQVEGEWWGYAYDGQTAGAPGINKALTAYRVKIVQRVYVAPTNKTITNTSESVIEDNSFTCPGLESNQIYLNIDENDYKIYYEYSGSASYVSSQDALTNPYSPIGYWGNEITLDIDTDGLFANNVDNSFLNLYVLPSDYFETEDINAAMNILNDSVELNICYGTEFGLANQTFVSNDASGFTEYNALDNKLGWYWFVGYENYDFNTYVFSFTEVNELAFGPIDNIG